MQWWCAFVAASFLAWPFAANGPLVASPLQDEQPSEPSGESQDDGSQDEDPVQPFATAEDLKKLELPVIDRKPFDRLHFDDENVPTVDVDPLVLEGIDKNSPVDASAMKGRLVFSIAKFPGRVFAAPWSAITGVERYIELVLNEAREAMRQSDFKTAFRTLNFLVNNSESHKAEISQMLDECLYLDGRQQLESGQYGAALAAWEELYQRNPRYSTGGSGSVLDNVIKAYEQFLQKEFDLGGFHSVRELLAAMSAQYGERVDSTVAAWETRMRDKALAQLSDVRSAMDAGDELAAHLAAREVLYAMPDLPNARVAYNSVIARFPLVMVGVSQPASEANPLKIENWPSRRVGRLVDRTLLEFVRPGDDGGIYQVPGGRFTQADDLGYRFRFTLNPTEEPGIPPLTAYELSNRLMDLADEESPDYYIPWARMIAGIEIENDRSVVIRLRNPHVRPEAIMPLGWFEPGDPRHEEYFALYKPVEARDDLTVYRFNDRYERPDGQLPTIVERVYGNSAEAANALLRGELDLVDRVLPIDVERLRQDPMIEVKPYLIPLVHLLVPNPRNEFMKSDAFRRALHYAINRELILKEMLTVGREINGFQVISGPFPPGTDTADQLAYAYNTDVPPRQHDLKLALVLVQQFIDQRKRFLVSRGEMEVDVRIPKLVLAHPDSSVAKDACEAIALQWRAAGIPEVELRALPPGVALPEDDDYDMLYCEIQIQEPLVDAYRIFGKDGLVKISDATIEQALRGLDSAYSWAEVSKALRRVHSQAYANLTILPLWQTVEYCAWRRNLYNVGDRIVFLYQNAGNWRIEGIGSIDFSANTPGRTP